jgi:hypothetical protein
MENRTRLRSILLDFCIMLEFQLQWPEVDGI